MDQGTRSRKSVADSYPTFWNDPPRPPVTDPVPPDEAYSTFVTLTEGELLPLMPLATHDSDRA